MAATIVTPYLMTRGEIRRLIRYRLGEATDGTWSDEELNAYIWLACNRHAQEAWSVPAEKRTTSIYGKPEYELPLDYGELNAVRYTDTIDTYGLWYIEKTKLIEWGYNLTSIGDPFFYYYFNNMISLFPIPRKSPVLMYTPEDAKEQDADQVVTWRQAWDGTDELVAYVDWDLEKDPDDTRTVENENELYPQVFYISHVEITLRRHGPSLPGRFWLGVTPPDCPEVISYSNDATVMAQPTCIVFDFSDNPIEIFPETQRFKLTFHTDDEYKAYLNSSPNCNGIEVVGDSYDPNPVPFFQLHEQRKDIQIDYYKNEVKEPETDSEHVEVPNRYREHIMNLVLEMAYDKDGINMNLALKYRADAMKQMMIAKNQEKQKVRGRRIWLSDRPASLIYSRWDGRTLRGRAF